MRWLFALALAVSAPALAATPIEAAQRAELDRVRAAVADQIHLSAYDLIDELVYGWTSDPIFERPTPVVLAGVTVPVGLGTGMQALLENHIAAVLIHNPASNVQLVHCPECTAVVVHSGPEGTVVTRGIDNPDVLAALGEATGKHALFIDVEAEGSWLVLRARLTQLTPDLPIVWSHTLSTAGSAPALLRQPEDLKSAAAAREEYMDALHDRGPITVPLRFAIRAYDRPDNGQGSPPPPFIWIQSGVELGSSDSRAWMSSMILGYSLIPQAYQGIMAQSRVSRLMTGRTRSLTHPDLYLFVGGAIMTVWGPATAAFRNEVLTTDEIIADFNLETPRASFGTLQIGVDVRIGNRIGIGGFMETLPSLSQSNNLGAYAQPLGIRFQSIGSEVTFCF